MSSAVDSSKKIVIMQILPKLISGGVERGAVDIAKAAANSGLTPIVVSSGGNMVYQLKEFGIKHINLPVNSKNPFTIYKNIKKIADLIKEYKVDIVHVRSRAPAWSAYYACLKTKCKLITTVHGSYSANFLGQKESSLKKAYNRIMLKGIFVIAVSNFIKNFIRENYSEDYQILKDRLIVIHRGVDLGYFSPAKVSESRIIQLAKSWHLPDDKKIIMLPSRISSWKGHEFLIDSLSKVKSNDFFCIIVGSDYGHKAYRKRLERKIEEKNLSGKIRMIGVTKDMPAAYTLSDIIISASIRPEAFGRVAIEAAAMKKIVIATKIGGSLETIIDGETGFLVQPENAEDMAAKIDHILSLDKTQIEQIASKAREHIIANFSNQKMCQETIDLYKKIVEGDKIVFEF